MESLPGFQRAIGYCENTGCEDYAQDVFLLNHGDTFYCPRCRMTGFVEHERGAIVGTSHITKEVRVEFNYSPIERRYREIAIVRDESVWGRNNVYTLISSLIKTEKRAFAVAESILAVLNHNPNAMNDNGIVRTTQTVLSFDLPFDKFSLQLAQIATEWENSSLKA